MRILIIEDTPTDVRLIREALEDSGEHRHCREFGGWY